MYRPFGVVCIHPVHRVKKKSQLKKNTLEKLYLSIENRQKPQKTNSIFLQKINKNLRKHYFPIENRKKHQKTKTAFFYRKSSNTLEKQYFFTENHLLFDGEKISVSKVKLTLKKIIDNEDKNNPLSDDDLKESEMTPEQRRAAGERCKQLGYLTASEAQKRLLMAINNFNRASAGKLLEPNK